MDKLIAAFLDDRQIFLLLFLFLVMLGVCLHLHGDNTAVSDVHLTALTQWAREGDSGGSGGDPYQDQFWAGEEG